MYGPFDKQLELRDIAAGTVTATTAEAGKAIAVAMAGTFKAVFYVSALDTGSGNETYALSIETDSATAFASPISIGSVPVTTTGVFELPLTQWQVAQLDATAAAIRCKATLGGTTPSITYGCYLAKAD